jgi:hypothetical protein
LFFCPCGYFDIHKELYLRGSVQALKQEDLTGATIDRFAYDTPTYPQEDFYALCDDDRPLVLVFLPNFGHPISRVFLTHYEKTLEQLQSGRLACVVHSDPRVIARNLTGEYPFPLICDASGVLYDYFNVKSTSSRFRWSMKAARIFRRAAAHGYQMEKGASQQLPLTLVVGRGGVILFSHYGESLTDMPEDCAAMESVCAHLLEKLSLEPQPQNVPDDEPADEPEEDYVSPLASSDEEEEAAPERPQPVSAEEPAPIVPDEEEDPIPDTMLEPIEPQGGDEPAYEGGHSPSPENPESWNRLLGLFAEGKN